MSTHSSDAKDRRLKIARTVYDALVAQNLDRQITLCDGAGRVIASNERGAAEDASDPLEIKRQTPTPPVQ
jgi:hypothetical protein